MGCYIEPIKSHKTDATAAFLASLEEPKLTTLAEAGKQPPIEILPPGMISLSSPFSMQKKPPSAAQNSQQLPSKPLALEAPTNTTTMPMNALKQSASTLPATTTAPMNTLKQTVSTTTKEPAKALKQSKSTPTFPTTTTESVKDLKRSKSAPTLPTITTEPVTAIEQCAPTPTPPTTSMPMCDLKHTTGQMNSLKQFGSIPTPPVTTTVPMNALKQSETTPTPPITTTMPMNTLNQTAPTMTSSMTILSMNALKQSASTPTSALVSDLLLSQPTSSSTPPVSDPLQLQFASNPILAPPQMGSREIIVDNVAHSASSSDIIPIGRGDTVQAASMSNSVPPEVPLQVADSKEGSIPTTIPPTVASLRDFLA